MTLLCTPLQNLVQYIRPTTPIWRAKHVDGLRWLALPLSFLVLPVATFDSSASRARNVDLCVPCARIMKIKANSSCQSDKIDQYIKIVPVRNV